MELFDSSRRYNLLSWGTPLFALSLFLMIGSLVLLTTKGVNFGIDFAGGTVIQVQYQQAAPMAEIRERLRSDALFAGAQVSEFGSPEELLIKTQTIEENLGEDPGKRVAELLQGTGELEIRRVDIVGPKVGDELKEAGILSVLLASLAIMVYVSIRYEWRFAVAAIAALFHDILITLGALSLYGIDANLEVVAALLTILGYSINDTIIVFDRIRESLRENMELHEIKEIVNSSMSRTLARTTLTSLTVFFVVLTLFLFGGEIIVGFSFPLLVGVVVGTYSSIFIASQVVIWLGLKPDEFRKKEAEAKKRASERAKMRQMYEQGVV